MFSLVDDAAEDLKLSDEIVSLKERVFVRANNGAGRQLDYFFKSRKNIGEVNRRIRQEMAEELK